MVGSQLCPCTAGAPHSCRYCCASFDGIGPSLLWLLITLYTFLGLAIICDDYFCESLERISEALKLSEDVAGATFMAAGSSAPELFTAIVTILITNSSEGLGTIVGSAIFNIMVIVGVTAIFAGSTLHIWWYPLVRDSVVYFLSIIMMVVVMVDKQVTWVEALALVLAYGGYIGLMAKNDQIARYVQQRSAKKKNPGAVVPLSGKAPTEADISRAASQLHAGAGGERQPMVKGGGGGGGGNGGAAWAAPESGEGGGGEDQRGMNPMLRPAFRSSLKATVSRERAEQRAQMTRAVASVMRVHHARLMFVKKIRARDGVSRAGGASPSASSPKAAAAAGTCSPPSVPGTPRRKKQRKSKRPRKRKKSATAASLSALPENGVATGATAGEMGAAGPAAAGAGGGSGKGKGKGKGGKQDAVTDAERTSSDRSDASGGDVELELLGVGVESDSDQSPSGRTPPAAASQQSAGSSTAEGSGREKGEGENGSGGGGGGKVAEAAEAGEAEAAEADDGEQQLGAKILGILGKPMSLAMQCTIPDCRKEKWANWYMGTFVMSIVWIGTLSFVMVDFAARAGCIWGIPALVMGLVVIAAGTSVPDALSSVLVAKLGQGNMAVANVLGSNVFNIFLGLGLPWLIKCGVDGQPITLPANEDVTLPVIVLLLYLVFFVTAIAALGWTLNKRLGYIFFAGHAVFITWNLLTLLPDPVIKL